MSTPLSKGRNLAGSPLTLDKFEASMAVSRENKQHSPPNKTISGETSGVASGETSSETSGNIGGEAEARSGASGGSGESEFGVSGGGEKDSSYNRQLRHHHQTTLRELAHARAACARMASERTSYSSQIVSMDVQMRAMQELVAQLERARNTMKIHHQKEKSMLEQQMKRCEIFILYFTISLLLVNMPCNLIEEQCFFFFQINSWINIMSKKFTQKKRGSATIKNELHCISQIIPRAAAELESWWWWWWWWCDADGLVVFVFRSILDPEPDTNKGARWWWSPAVQTHGASQEWCWFVWFQR